MQVLTLPYAKICTVKSIFKTSFPHKKGELMHGNSLFITRKLVAVAAGAMNTVLLRQSKSQDVGKHEIISTMCGCQCFNSMQSWKS